MRQKLYVKFGEYNNKEDLAHCQSLLELYRSQQAMMPASNNSTSMSFNSVKTYPLAFNAYGLDKDDKTVFAYYFYAIA